MVPRSAPIIGIAIGAALLMCGVALSVGKFAITPRELLSLLSSLFSGGVPDAPANADIVLFQIRGPRVLAAFAVGAALAAAGAAYQNLFRNPLASPDILGVSSGAALGAIAGLFLALPIALTQSLAFAGGIAAVALITTIGDRVRGRDPVLSLVLTGVVVGSLFGAGIALAKYLADPYNQLPAITYWLLGSFAAVTRRDLAFALPVIVLAAIPLVLLRWRINVLALPEDEARALGLDVRATRRVVIVAATLMTAASVAVCGVVGWVGLVVPHAVRLLVGAEFSRVLPLAMLAGGTFLLAVDTLGRTMAAIEIPPGVLTAALGAPVFIALLARTARNEP